MIKPGMLVEIVDHQNFKQDREWIGYVGEVTRLHIFSDDSGLGADVAGTESVEGEAWPIEYLRPIDDDQQASWDNEVWQKLGWQPERVEA